MGKVEKYYQVRIAKPDPSDGDDLVLSSVGGLDNPNPYIAEAPSGDGESIDPITGKPTTGSYSVRVYDHAPDPDAPEVRVLTSILADVNARQQLIARKVYVESGNDPSGFPDTIVVGYVTAIRLVSGIMFEIAIGQSRRIENSREVFKAATPLFPSTTSVIGGPILGGFGTLVTDTDGWTMKVDSVGTSPDFIKLELVTGIDARKPDLGSFSSVSSAINDYTNNYARPYFEPFALDDDYITGPDIQGHFPQMRARLIPITNPGDPTIEIVPLSAPNPSPGAWWTDNLLFDNLLQLSCMWIETDTAIDISTGLTVTFSPAPDDEFEVYVYAIPVSENNPLHIFRNPIDLWADLMTEARIAYDETVLSAVKDLVNDQVKAAISSADDIDVRLALKITQSYKLGDFLQQCIYGPFRLSTRLVDGKQTLFSIRVTGATPVQTITPADLRQDETTLFDLDEQTVVTAINLKTKRIYLWSTTESEQPTADRLLSVDAATSSIENSDDDMPGWDGLDTASTTLREVSIGEIPGMIVVADPDTDVVLPFNFDAFLADIADEIFQRMGRGAIGCELACLPSVTAQVGDVVTLELPRVPGALSSQSPTSQRGTQRDFQVVQRTEIPEGSNLKLVDAFVE